MVKYHLKRKVVPKTWPILRKATTFITRPRPNGHKMEFTLPVVVVLRDMLDIVQTAKQARAVMKANAVAVNGKRVYATDASVALMDVLSVDKDQYRIILNKNNILEAVPVKKGEEFIVQRIVNKTTLKGGKVQLNMLSGTNVIAAKDTYKVNDSVAVADGKIKDHFPFKEGASIVVVGGSHIGKTGTISKINRETRAITLKAGKEEIETSVDYAFVIGKDKPAITL